MDLKGAVAAYFKALYELLPKDSGENHGRLSVQSVIRTRFE